MSSSSVLQAVDEIGRGVHRGDAGPPRPQGDPLLGETQLRAGAERLSDRQWREVFLAYLATDRANNGGTKAINGVFELRRRIAHGFRFREHERLRVLFICGGLTHPPPAERTTNRPCLRRTARTLYHRDASRHRRHYEPGVVERQGRGHRSQ